MRVLNFSIATIFMVLVFGSGNVFARKHHNSFSTQAFQQSITGAFDYYLLSLSWSPAFCSSKAGQKPEKQYQCHGHYGFVIHGLWPQYSKGQYPQNCGPEAHVPEEVSAIALQAVPPMPPGDDALIDHEWRVHGTCSGLNMKQYFTAIKLAASKIAIPAELGEPKQPVREDFNTIVKWFIDSNPGLQKQMLQVITDKYHNLSEVRICFDKQLNFLSCKNKKSSDSLSFLPVQ